MAGLDILRTVASQYGASLAMLGRAIDVCPEPLWLSEDHKNRFWHIAYHALFYTHFYLQPVAADFHAWDKHRPDYQYLGPRPGPSQEAVKADTPYTKTELLEYYRLCRAEIDTRVPALDLMAPSGFDWLPFDKLELQFYNIRHIQHHTGQLADRLRSAANIGLEWVRP
jgi:hypothetical protein